MQVRNAFLNMDSLCHERFAVSCQGAMFTLSSSLSAITQGDCKCLKVKSDGSESEARQ